MLPIKFRPTAFFALRHCNRLMPLLIDDELTNSPRLQDWRNDSRGGGDQALGASRKGSPNVSKGPKAPIQLFQLLKNSSREVKTAHFRYTLGPPGPT